MDRKILIIVPAYNEETALSRCISQLTERGVEADILIVNDGSKDATEKRAKELAEAFPNVYWVTLPMNSGIGAAVQTGLLYASKKGYDYAIQFDGDGQHDPGSIPDLLRCSRENELDLCVGSRFLDEKDENFRSSTMRRMGIYFFAWLIGVLTGIRVTDPTSGFRVYGKRAIAFFSRYYPDDYPEPEALFWCARNHMRVGEVTARMYERQGGVSSINYFKAGYYMIKVTVAILIDRIRAREVKTDER